MSQKNSEKVLVRFASKEPMLLMGLKSCNVYYISKGLLKWFPNVFSLDCIFRMKIYLLLTKTYLIKST